jgi:hypothetical protein
MASDGPLDVRRVFLTQQPITGTFTNDALLGPATDHFRQTATSGYVYIVFNDSAAHRVQFNVRRTRDASEFFTYDQTTNFDSRPWQWRATYFQFPIAGRLPLGGYNLTLMVDGVPTGTHPFTVE